ncbi:hypothetical protein JFL43_04110 [Viridibacillus sp. YIM B01967]|uniref:Transposase n=1 Tax=Viridibacillus soli TaxID=2798301 RepID=A0ABS1H3T2_9BACL|nr:hypothetical protein [Viridibacillus soli]MBK3494056.1 hypothetical protein [Viridibacillus soli]
MDCSTISKIIFKTRVYGIDLGIDEKGKGYQYMRAVIDLEIWLREMKKERNMYSNALALVSHVY